VGKISGLPSVTKARASDLERSPGTPLRVPADLPPRTSPTQPRSLSNPRRRGAAARRRRAVYEAPDEKPGRQPIVPGTTLGREQGRLMTGPADVGFVAYRCVSSRTPDDEAPNQSAAGHPRAVTPTDGSLCVGFTPGHLRRTTARRRRRRSPVASCREPQPRPHARSWPPPRPLAPSRRRRGSAPPGPSSSPGVERPR
jgi:hypothetical protein